MTSSFNPYYKWLGIPPEDRPAHHYRLLGVELFESDPDVIVIAADGRMAQLKNFQTGKYSKLSQKLLNEIAAAKICLLNSKKRAAYDDALRQRLEEAKKPAVKAVPAGRKPGSQAAAGESKTGDDAAPGVVAPRINPAGASSYVSRHSRKRGHPWLLPAAVALVAAAVIAALVFALRGDGNNETVRQGDPPDGQAGNGLSNRPPRVRDTEPPDPYPPDFPPDDTPPEDPGNGLPIDPDMVASAADPGRSLADLVDPMKPGNPPPGDEEPVPAEPSPGDPPAAKRAAEPDAAAKKEAEAEIRAAFKKELAEAKTRELKLRLVEVLFAASRDPGNTQAARFMLMQIACQTAAEAGGLAESLAVAGELEKQYDLDGKQIRSDVFKTVRESLTAVGRDVSAIHSIIDTATQQADAALADDDMETAGDAMQLALAAARVTKDKYILRHVITRVGEITVLKNVFRKVKLALETLAEKPDDPEANWEVGRWRCFCTGAWQAGLPMLAKGSDDKVAELAKLDIAQPKDVKDQVRLGDGWFALADKGKESKYAKIELYLRAKHWYERALPNLASVEKRNVENRLKEVAEALLSAGPRVGGALQAGNLALATNGTKVSGKGFKLETLLDGNSTKFTSSVGRASITWPGVLTFSFQKKYQLKEIRFRLYDLDKRFSRYKIETSEDGRNYTTPVPVDHSKGAWSSWQVLKFAPRPVSSIRLHCLFNSISPAVHIVEFEAYSISPKPFR